MARDSQSEADRALVERGKQIMSEAEPHHTRWRAKANHHWGLWNNYQDLRDALADASPRGRDTIWRDAESTWGAPYFVPMVFGTIETILPEMVANRPKMLALPRDRAAEANAENMQFLIDAQQQQCNYELELHTIAKDGLVTGMGWQKCYWRQDFRKRTRLAPSQAGKSMNPSGWQEIRELVATFDDAVAEAIDPNDMFWDPHAPDVPRSNYLVHRTWRPMRYLEQQAASGRWRNLGDIAKIEGLGEPNRYDEVWQERLRAMGYDSFAMRGHERVHEVLEFWVDGGETTFTLLDREICVEARDNPNWHGEYPFQCFTPTEIPHRIEGKSEVEPIQDLQAEINDLRRDRRDNVRMILHRIVAYADGMVQPDDMKWGPAMAWPVTGDPKESLFPIPVQDIPYSGWQEEDRLKDDFQWTSGLSDPTAPSSVQQTATGAQIVAAATSRRIANKTRRMELQIMAPGTCQFGYLNQQKILDARDVRIPQTPMPGQPDRRWAWKQLGPAELAGEFAWYPEGGSVPAENVPQNRADAQALWTMFGNHQRARTDEVMKEVFRLYGIKTPENFIAPPEPRTPPAVLDILVNQFGVPRELIAEALNTALQAEGGLGPGQNTEGDPGGAGAPMNGNGAVPAG